MRTALIQGIKNANKTGVRFGWCSNGGFLEGAGYQHFLTLSSVNAFGGTCHTGPRKCIDPHLSCADGRESGEVASKLLWIYNGLGISLCRFQNGATVWPYVFQQWLSKRSISKKETKSRFPSQVNATSRWPVTDPKRGRSSSSVK